GRDVMLAWHGACEAERERLLALTAMSLSASRGLDSASNPLRVGADASFATRSTRHRDRARGVRFSVCRPAVGGCAECPFSDITGFACWLKSWPAATNRTAGRIRKNT